MILRCCSLIRLARSLMLSGGFALVSRKDPLIPLLSRAQPINAIFVLQIINISQLAGDVAKKFEVLGQSLDALEASNESQWDVALRVHVSSKEQVLAQVIHREVVLKLHRDHTHKGEGLHILLVRDSGHGARVYWLVAIHGVDIGGERIDTIHGSRVW